MPSWGLPALLRGRCPRGSPASCGPRQDARRPGGAAASRPPCHRPRPPATPRRRTVPAAWIGERAPAPPLSRLPGHSSLRGQGLGPAFSIQSTRSTSALWAQLGLLSLASVLPGSKSEPSPAQPRWFLLHSRTVSPRLLVLVEWIPSLCPLLTLLSFILSLLFLPSDFIFPTPSTLFYILTSSPFAVSFTQCTRPGFPPSP